MKRLRKAKKHGFSVPQRIFRCKTGWILRWQNRIPFFRMDNDDRRSVPSINNNFKTSSFFCNLVFLQTFLQIFEETFIVFTGLPKITDYLVHLIS